MRNKPAKRKSKSRRQLFLEALAPRLVLTGAVDVIDLNAGGASDPREFVQVGDVAFFSAEDETNGRELWRTDGTESGTAMVANIQPGSGSSNPSQLTEFNGKLFFVANDGSNGEELWMSDGTDSGTVLVRDINPGTGYQAPYGDGPLQSLATELTEFNGELLFGAVDSATGDELWKTDGSTSGTVLVNDIAGGTFTDNDGTHPNSSDPSELTVVGSTLFFSADDGQFGRELWQTDGTASGTSLVRDIATGNSNPSQMTEFSGLLFFVAEDTQGNTELWRSDGTVGGTVEVLEIAAGDTGALSVDDALAEYDGRLFFAANDGIAGKELWSTDGTEAGTRRETDLNGDSADSIDTFQFATTSEAIYFSATNGSTGQELWRLEASGGGASPVRDIHAGEASSDPLSLTTVGNRVFFSATTSASGRELWESDGTEAGTTMVDEIAAGSTGSSPSSLFNLDGLLLFNANSGDGEELHVVDTDGVNDTSNAGLTVFVHSQFVSIPANIGVDSSGNLLSPIRTDSAGNLVISPVAGESVAGTTLGDFFETWRTNAGVAGDNASATFDDGDLLGNVQDATNTVKMFVNGQVNEGFDNYVIQDSDEIILVFGDDPIVSVNTNFGPIVMELFEDVAPGTVNNFLNYINDGDYVNSFFHRSANNSSGADFVIQGGGFRTTSTTFTSTAQFSSVPTDAPIQNEPSLSNVRGTVAMAKTSNPDSATSQFFVNLNNQNTFLDNPNNSGGFTVFAQVLDLTTSDTIAALPVRANTSPYGELPVSTDDQLVVVQSIEGHSRFSGTKFTDTNANGVQDAGEVGLSGVTIYFDDNSNGVLDAGERSTQTDSEGRYLLEAETGTYTIRAEITPGQTDTSPNGRYIVVGEIGVEATGLDFGETMLVAPSSIDLVSTSDTGAADDDDLTRLNNADAASTLQLEVSGVTPGATVRIFSDGVQIGAAISSTATVTIETDATNSLADGSRVLTATQLIGASESDASPSLTINIDSVAPADFTNTAPDIAQAGQAYTHDVDSLDEGQTGTEYSLADAPTGMAIDADGIITWTPTANQAVPTTFTIHLTDQAGNSASQTVDLTVLGVIPAMPEDYATDEDVALIVDAATGVLANDGDGNSSNLTVAVIDSPASGTISLDPNGGFTYTPNANFFGTDSFTYQATDGVDVSNVARVMIDVAALNDAPAPTVDSYTTNEDTQLTMTADLGVLSNDTDVDGDTLTASLATQAANGTVSLNSDGSFTYTPNAEHSGSDSFTYTVSDDTVTSDPVTVTLSVTEVNDVPVAAADSYSVTEDIVLDVDAANGVLANDTDETDLSAILRTTPSFGTVVLNTDGSFTYTPTADFNGTDLFTYVANDGELSSAEITVNITIDSAADPPSATDDDVTAPNSGAQQSLDVLANDTSDPDVSQTLTISSVTQGSSGGVVNIDGDRISYTAPTGFIGSETFTYTITDSDGLADTANVVVTVQDASDNTLQGFVYIDFSGDGDRESGEPGVPGVLITLTGTDQAGNAISQTTLTANDGSYQFDELASGTYTLTETHPTALVNGTAASPISGSVVSENQLSSLTISGGQTFAGNNFTERDIASEFITIHWFFASAASSQDSMFRETLADAEEQAGNTALADAIRNGADDLATPPNTAPIAAADNYSGDQDQTLSIPAASGVLANDVDSSGDTLTAALVTPTSNGTLTLRPDGSFDYIPSTGFNGSDTFTYNVTDLQGLVDTAIVSITINAQDNVFLIAENALAGTTAGTVIPQTVSSTDAIFELLDSSQEAELELVADDHLTGNTSASVTLIEYVDFQCPICATFHPIVEQLVQDFPDDLLVVRRHLPLESIHVNARAAAIASEAASRQGAFDEYADQLFDNQSEWEFVADPQSLFQTYASNVGLNLSQFITDQADPVLNDRVQRDLDAASSLGATGTPTFYLNGERITNPASQPDFASLIQAEISSLDSLFTVDRTTGEIVVREDGLLDFETAPSQMLNVAVKDLSGGSETIVVTINLIDITESSAEGEFVDPASSSLQSYQDSVDQAFADLA